MTMSPLQNTAVEACGTWALCIAMSDLCLIVQKENGPLPLFLSLLPLSRLNSPFPEHLGAGADDFSLHNSP